MSKQIHDRKSLRLKGYDYTRSGRYFITICTHQMRCIFGEVRNGCMILNEFGTIARDQWFQIPIRFPSVTLDEFIVMPNHIHGIIVLHKPAAAVTVGNVVGAYKSLVVTHCMNYVKTHQPDTFLGKLWQRNYWDQILNDDDRFECTRHYIRNNPAKWDKRKQKGEQALE